MRSGIRTLACVLLFLVTSSPARAEFFFCYAASNGRAPPPSARSDRPASPPVVRGRGLILSYVFESRIGDAYFIENAFKRYLETSYAPYGNGWRFPEDGVTCPNYEERIEAENERMKIAGEVRQPEEELFNVPFVSE